jgi:hypothetical protein
MALTPSTVTILSLDIQEQVRPPDIGVAGTVSLGGTGTRDPGDGLLPQGLVPIVRLKGNVVSRSARGYTTPPAPVNSNALDDGAWSSSYLGELGDFCEVLTEPFDLGAVFPTQVNPVCYSRKRHLLEQEPWTFRVIGATPNTRPHWRRSRTTAP